jgi:hypothetical protein
MYHDWFALILLAWIVHSILYNNIHLFQTGTLYCYLPMFILVFVIYYVVNINGFRIQPDSTRGLFPLDSTSTLLRCLQVGYLLFNLFMFFAWIKSCEGLSMLSDEYRT